jgi:dienelactone hydrolase
LYKTLSAWCLVIGLLVSFNTTYAQQIRLPSEVIFIPKKIMLGTLKLETTIYKPEGQGPFPLVVINHGKESGPPGLQRRFTAGWASRFFLERGYVVFVPMRTGFSKSTGSYVSGECNVESNGYVQAEDVTATVSYAHTLDYVDRKQTLVVGQSHGGWTTLAYGASNPDPSVKGLVNFAGGLRQSNCTGWELNLAKGAASFAKKTSIPSLWLYGENDSFFTKQTYTEMFARYSKVNPNAQLVEFGVFGEDAHGLFTHKNGRAVWEPYLEKFMMQLGMPIKVIYPQYKPG